MLGAVALRIAAMRGNVVGLEVLERHGGMAIDDLVVELLDRNMVDELCTQVRQIDGAGVEDFHFVAPDAEDRGLEVVAAAISILETANPTAALAALMGHTLELFRAEWAGLADLGNEAYVESAGPVPPIDQLLASVRSDSVAVNNKVDHEPSWTPQEPENGSGGRGLLVEKLQEIGLNLALGRTAPFRTRERREVEMLARVTDRACRPALHADRIPPGW